MSHVLHQNIICVTSKCHMCHIKCHMCHIKMSHVSHQSRRLLRLTSLTPSAFHQVSHVKIPIHYKLHTWEQFAQCYVTESVTKITRKRTIALFCVLQFHSKSSSALDCTLQCVFLLSSVFCTLRCVFFAFLCVLHFALCFSLFSVFCALRCVIWFNLVFCLSHSSVYILNCAHYQLQHTFVFSVHFFLSRIYFCAQWTECMIFCIKCGENV